MGIGLFVAALLAGSAVGQEGAAAFQSETVAQALARGRGAGRSVMVVVAGSPCADCDRLDAETLAEESVKAWVNAHCVAVRVETATDVGRSFLQQWDVDTVPTVLFLNPHGAAELRRMHGFVGVSDFLEGATEAFDAFASDFAAAEPSPPKSPPQDMIERGKQLAAAGQRAEALDEYVACLDAYLRNVDFRSKYMTPLIETIVRLGEEYPPAAQTLLARRAEAEGKLRGSRQVDVGALYVFVRVNEALDETDLSIALYDELKEQAPDGRTTTALARLIYRPLFDAGRFRDVSYAAEHATQVGARLKMGKDNPAERENSIRLVAEIYRLLLGLGRPAEAEQVAGQLLTFEESALTYSALAENAVLSGQPPAAALDFAQRAVDITDGLDAKLVCLYARVAAAQGLRQQAVARIESAMDCAPTEESRKVLTECLTGLGAPASP